MQKNPYVMKGLVVGIILLFAGTCILPAIAQYTKKSQLTSRGEWLYVGGDGPGNYTRIQDAINNASEGDTIFVYHGNYYEYNLKLSQINLIGEDRNTTIIDGQGIFSEVIHIEDGTNIHGFTLTNFHIGAVGLFIAGNNITISDIIFTKCGYGIYVRHNSQIEIYNNVFFNNTEAGISFHSSSCSIHNNYFVSNHKGILGEDGVVSIDHNQFEDNTIGIDTAGFRAKIQRNNFINNNQHVNLTTVTSPLTLPLILYNKAHWSKNYWDDWNRTNPRPIQGTFVFYIGNIIWLCFPLILFSSPIVHYDWFPAQEPYDIPRMR
ncbi:MAG: right-handed parallel beta-helix repeat-containing protein [Candidatus Thermoplasmatota archaeon]|nr:right-handed parallel beta-helix repeat-containing protein [Candidatus Thermoplasmatota archaeon]